MPIPDFQSIMLPLLRLASDGELHTFSEAIAKLALEFKLNEAEMGELLPSGRARKFSNRVGWSKTYLKKTCLIEDQGRGRFRITERGRQVLGEKPHRVDLKYLSRFPELDDFRRRRDDGADEPAGEQVDEPAGNTGSVQTPEELLESSFQQVRKKLAEDLLERLRTSSPAFFEKVVVDLLVRMGYGGSRRDAGKAVGRSGDDGIDGIIKEDRLGLDAVYVQAKRWEAAVGRPVVQAFAGSLEGHRARKGVLITTSRFSQDARDYVSRIEKKIVLVDGLELATLMIEFGVGVAEVASYAVKRVDLDYFAEDEE